MRKIFTYLYCIVLPIIGACSASSVENDAQVDNSFNDHSSYYVKYASDGLVGNGIYGYNVSYTDENGKKQSFFNMTSDSFERTIGPVSIGYEASFHIWVSNTNDTKTRAARIEVKKDNNPFVVKVENSGKGSGGVTVTYTINGF